jgi:hypothetical protein
MRNVGDKISVADIENAIYMLNEYTNEAAIKQLVSILEELKRDTQSESLLARLTEAWRNLGGYQGTVLTYVPYFYTFIPDDIFGDNPE